MHNQIDRHIALVILSILFNQLPNTLVILIGGGMLYVISTICQIIKEKVQERKGCSIISVESQKQHFLEPCQFLLAKLSLLSNTLFFRSHMNILIVSGILNFHGLV
jgi:hypothetical protein